MKTKDRDRLGGAVVAALVLAMVWSMGPTGVRASIDLPASTRGHAVFDDAFTEPSGAFGRTMPQKTICDVFVGQPRIIMYPPVAMTASYDTSDREAQTVWWQPRLWYIVEDTVNVGPWAEYGWHYTTSRLGFNQGELWAAPVPICAGDLPCLPGSAPTGATSGTLPNWTTKATGETHNLGWGLVTNPRLDLSDKWAVENVYYWEPNASQRFEGWDGEVVNVLVGDYQFDVGGPVCDFD